MHVPMEVGARLGHYEVLSAIGKGGMGEVWQARDLKLGREVAIKTLPAEFAQDADRLARFDREAKLLASLNHPNIAAIYGLEEARGTRFLALELVEGATLADRLIDGPIPVDEALGLALQIAEALDAAHEKGVIHRDLKPANIKVTPEGAVKVLDFGLAKAFAEETSSANLSNSPTLSMAATQQGLILGTAAYMSPEQTRGRSVDKRTDVWAFGCVLFEMLSGKPAFGGEDVTAILAAVVRLEPDWSALPAGLQPRLTELLRDCLVKKPGDRIRDIGDVRLAIRRLIDDLGTSAPVAGASSEKRLKSKLPWVAAILMAAILTGLGVWIAMRQNPQVPVHLTAFHPATEALGNAFDRDVAVTSDGQRIVYIADVRGDITTGRLYVRSLEQSEPTLLAERARAPFLSPDDEWVGFMASDQGQLMKVAITGGPAVPITGVQRTEGPRGATWGPDDVIVFATAESTTGLSKVSSGGEVEVLTKPDSAKGEADHLFPHFLPGGRAVLFTITHNQGIDSAQIAVLDLDTRQYRPLISGGSDARYIESGHIVYGVAGTLRAVAFDLDSLQVRGTPIPVLDSVSTKLTGAANFSISRNGTLAYLIGSTAPLGQRTLVWVDRKGGMEEATGMEPRGYSYPRISHDGRRVAVDEANQDGDIRVWNFVSRNFVRLTSDEGSELYPVWTSDDGQIAFGSGKALNIVYSKASNNTGPVKPLTPTLGKGTQSITPYFFAEKDQTLVFREQAHTETRDNIGMISLEGESAPAWLLASKFNERNAELSPDGSYMAYQSDESGRYEVYVRPFPNVEDNLWTISTSGGTKPLWSPAGRELFYIEPGQQSRLMAVPVQTRPTFQHGSPKPVLEWPYYSAEEGRAYDVSRDGQRFLALKTMQAQAGSDAAPPRIDVVLHWFEELKARFRRMEP